MLIGVPLELAVANNLIATLHRHHKPVVRDKFRVGCYDTDAEKLVGVAMCGRPLSRMLDDGKTLEALRLCTDGTYNACSFLYSRCARIAKEMGYSKIITYILDSEQGASLRASGWVKETDTRGGSWDTPSRRREDKAPTCPKQRYARVLNTAEYEMPNIEEANQDQMQITMRWE